MKNKVTTVTGTDIEEVKKLNSESGLSYNKAKILLAKQKGLLNNDDTGESRT
ncbi:hypothetical protein AWH56_020950 [Anaerobacillus isosaccharinicus]|uniref:DNA mismatch repair protein MutT n=1 Tax=Anaerobacillus isosaccharinicus TaxID=1532552 RepID=A0A7S7L638_9BACI|nr:hypothetical protein [Anaerobacillus isosaccharinicus]MBA5586622.1 hypothetical protein [Anaerobacillus isosaccharinicus]QOY35144.1 hypothetical protein AWH56_020950 [Anaerobacillus isosaccharinicus]